MAPGESTGGKQGGAGPLSPRAIGLLLGIAALIDLPVLALALRPAAPTTVEIGAQGFADDFDRAELGGNYGSTGGYWRLVDGELLSPGAHNNPLFLRAVLPDDVRVEFDARSASPDGDIRCEIFANGYDESSGYLLAFGDWNDSVSLIARLDERGVPVGSQLPEPIPNGGRVRVQRTDLHVEQGRRYHWKIERKGMTLSWYLDGELVEQMVDPEPLRGRGHDRFAFSTWDTDVFYDNLKITPL
ncbi:MAG TPA: hypothetical protein VMB50_14700 [Myxococcales bacterium]|nr:hypothetical protein [Myxococcales bacterium]